MREKIKEWYNGKWVPAENNPASRVKFCNIGQKEVHWTAKVIRTLVTFYLAHWKWLWGFAVSLVGVYLTLQ